MKRLVPLALLLVACATAPATLAPTTPLVHVTADGQTQSIHTPLTSPLAIIASLGLTLASGDLILMDGAQLDPAIDPPPTAPRSLTILRARPLTVIENGTAVPVRVAARSVGEALWRTGYRLTRSDLVTPEASTPLDGLTSIVITRALSLTLHADGVILSTHTRQTTIGAALAEAGLALVGQDYSLPAADQPLPPDGVIQIIRVREEILTALETIPTPVFFQAMPDQEIDTTLTLQPAVNGLKQRRLRLRYENGLEVSRVDEGETIAQQPTARIIGYGTHITLRTVDTPDGPLEYWRSFTMYATSYSPARAGVPVTAKYYGITASGKPLVKGLVAIDRKLIPFGTRLYVPGYGFAEAADTGGGVKGRWIDLGYDDSNYVSWHQPVTVYFLTPIPPADQITWIFPSTVP